ncbi:MAG: GspH/FimT family pseudopilin [Lautropia sp.]|nr:GspH/FimT family pseudopilin [Lautropia sp.]
MKFSQASAGFTLQEMLVVMAITGIVAAMAIPSFRNFAIQRSISAQITDLGSALRLARSEALKRGRDVSMCPTLKPEQVAPGKAWCNSSKAWETGYIIFIGSYTNQDQYIRIQQAYSNGGSIEADVGGAIRFRPNGVLKVGGATSFTFKPPISKEDPSYKVLQKKMCVSSTGVLAPC